MGRIDDSLLTIEGIEDGTERALQLAGLVSTLFKIKGVILVVTGQLAFDSYANTSSDKPELDLASFSGKLLPRTVLEVMRDQLHGRGSIHNWTVAGVPVRFQGEAVIINRELCRDFMTDHGVAKLLPAEEITAECILAAVYPSPDSEAQSRAHLLLMNGLTNAFQMNWTVLHTLCHRPEYRVGEELAQMRMEAKKGVDEIAAVSDPVGEPVPPQEELPEAEGEAAPAPSVSEEVVDAGISSQPETLTG